MPDKNEEIRRLETTIAALEAQRDALGTAVVDTTVRTLRERLETLRRRTPAQRKQVTVLVADLSGFTALAERLDAEELRDTIDAVWRPLDKIIVSWRGHIAQHMGDGVIAYFGVPVAHEDDPERAVAAALAMQEALREVNDAGEHANLAMRIGLHTGHVLLAHLADETELTAMGDAVTLASRLEALAPVGGVLISQEVHHHVADRFALQPEPSVTQSVGHNAYLVLQAGRPRVPPGGRRVAGVETSMIGRDRELRQLQEWIQEVISGKRGLAVSVLGDAGIGKSRLRHEFKQWLRYGSGLPPGFTLLEGRADLPMQQLPYGLFRELLGVFCDIQDNDPASAAREKLVSGITRRLGADLPEEAAVMRAHFVGQLIGFDFHHSPYLQGILDDARQIRQQAFTHLAEFFNTLGRHGPVVILMEDIHWADEGTLDLLGHLMHECGDIPLFMLLLARPSLFERRPDWSQPVLPGMRHTILPLEPLSASDCHELVTNILRHMPSVPSGLSAMIVDAAAGNPFYVEELIKVLLEDGLITRESGNWELASQPAELRIPTTLTGVLQARLDRLSRQEQDVLQRAAVVGRVFWDDAVAATGEGIAAILPQALQQLEEREFIFRRRASSFTGAREYTFKHAMLREVTYESVLVQSRRAHHATVAGWLEAQSGERVDEYAGLIGDHYELAGRLATAATWYGRAAEQARKRYTPETAIRYYRKALDYMADSEAKRRSRIRLYSGLGETLRWQARFGEAVEALHAMRSAAEAEGDLRAQVMAWEGLFLAHDYQGDHRAALESATGAERVARVTGSPADLAMALSAKGWALLFLGEEDEALALGKEARRFGEEAGTPRERAYSYVLLGGAYRMLQRFAESHAATQQALALFREMGDRVWEGSMLYNLGQTARLEGDYQLAVNYYEQALDVAQVVGDRYGAMLALSRMGKVARLQGAYRRAERNYRAALRLAEKSGNLGRRANLTASLGELLLAQALGGAPGTRLAYLERAERAFRQAVEQADAAGQAVTEAAAKVALARVLLAREDAAAALPTALAGLEAARFQALLWQGVAAEKVVGTAWWVVGQVAAHLPEQELPLVIEEEQYDVSACFAASMRIWNKVGGGVDWERARTLRDWGAFLEARGETERGKAMQAKAAGLFARLGIEHEIDRVNIV